MIRLFCALGILLFVTSCVPNRRYVYLQKDDVKSNNLPIDTVVRTYDIGRFDYKIQPQDVLYIRFESLTRDDFDFLSKQSAQVSAINPAAAALTGEMVDPAGDINFPVIGKVRVQGLSIFGIQDKLQELADAFLESPKVSVRLINFRVTLLGEVMREGQVTLSNNRVSMLEAIGVSGGLAEFADKRKIKVLRQEGDQVSVFYVNLLDENFTTSPYYYVHQNDVIVVPPLKQRPFRKYFAPNFALFVSTLSVVALLAVNITTLNRQQ